MSWLSILLEPAALVTWGVLVAGLFLWLKFRSIRQLVITACTLFIYLLFATPLGANILVSTLEKDSNYKHCNLEERSAVIVLAGGIFGDPESSDEVWRLKEDSYRRTLLGIKLVKTIKGAVLILSGGYGGQITEADLMEYLALQNGVGSKLIVKDREPRNTYQSAASVAKIIRNKKIEKSVLVTSAIHMRRASAAFRKAGIDPCQYSVNSRYVKTYFPEALFPQISALEKSTETIHEYLGYIWYWFSGRV